MKRTETVPNPARDGMQDYAQAPAPRTPIAARAARRAFPMLLAGILALGGCASAQERVPNGGQTEAASVETTVPGSPQSSAQGSSVTSYATARVSYLGPVGTYTHEACGRFFGGEGTYLPEETVADAVSKLAEGSCDYAVIPQENTIGGPVVDYVDILLDTESLSVVGEVELPISQNLLALPGTELSAITTVYSHKQGITQGKAWLEEHLPNAEVVEVSSTAEGARMVADAGDPTSAAIASLGCADVYQLEALATDIQQNDSNKTRFYVLSREQASREPSDRVAFVATGEASSLPELLGVAGDHGLEIVAVHDRPEKTELGRYRFLIECAGGDATAFDELGKVAGFDLRYLGSFPLR